MSKITVTAGEGVRAQVTVQSQETLTREIPAIVSVNDEIVAPARNESFTHWRKVEVVAFASEAREFEVGADQRLIVSEQA